MKNMNWFHTLNKPLFTPPDYIFTPMWVILYILIFVSFILFLKTGNIQNKKFALTVFIIQLLLNFVWSPSFFYMQNIWLAFVIIILMWIFIALNIFLFFKYSKIAAFLLIPYFLWVSFAAYLNFGYMILN